jgi:hypothetical protein
MSTNTIAAERHRRQRFVKKSVAGAKVGHQRQLPIGGVAIVVANYLWRSGLTVIFGQAAAAVLIEDPKQVLRGGVSLIRGELELIRGELEEAGSLAVVPGQPATTAAQRGGRPRGRRAGDRHDRSRRRTQEGIAPRYFLDQRLA